MGGGGVPQRMDAQRDQERSHDGHGDGDADDAPPAIRACGGGAPVEPSLTLIALGATAFAQ